MLLVVALFGTQENQRRNNVWFSKLKRSSFAVLAAQNLWKIRALRMDLRRLMALRQRLTNEAECYRLARDCYWAIQKLDEAKK